MALSSRRIVSDRLSWLPVLGVCVCDCECEDSGDDVEEGLVMIVVVVVAVGLVQGRAVECGSQVSTVERQVTDV